MWAGSASAPTLSDWHAFSKIIAENFPQCHPGLARDCTDALWAATLAANKGPGQWYADSDSLRYSFFDKVADDD